MNFKILLDIGLISIITILLSSSLSNNIYASGQMIADAGFDQIVNEHVKVSLDGSMSNDPEGQELSYMWTQISGEPVVLSSTSSVTPSFTSPTVANGEIKTLVFELKVFDDNGREDVDTVTITVDSLNSQNPEENITQNVIGIEPTSLMFSVCPYNGSIFDCHIVSIPSNTNLDIEIRGVLKESNTYEDIPGKKIEIQTPSDSTTIITSNDGSFSYKSNINFKEGENLFSVSFVGDVEYQPTSDGRSLYAYPIFQSKPQQPVDKSKHSEQNYLFEQRWEIIENVNPDFYHKRLVDIDPYDRIFVIVDKDDEEKILKISNDGKLIDELSLENEQGDRRMVEDIDFSSSGELYSIFDEIRQEWFFPKLVTTLHDGISGGVSGAIALDKSGNIFYHLNGEDTIKKIHKEGSFLKEFSISTPNLPVGTVLLEVDPYGNVFVGDANNYQILKFDNNGRFLTSWGSEGAGPSKFANIKSLAVDNNGNVYVADVITSKIEKFDNDGNFITEFSFDENGETVIGPIDSITVDSFESVYVTDQLSGYVHKFSLGGSSPVGSSILEYNGILEVPSTNFPPTIDGMFTTSSEWDDASVNHIKNDEELYVLAKHDGNYIYILVDPISFQINPNSKDKVAGIGIEICFDVDHDGRNINDEDDFCFVSGESNYRTKDDYNFHFQGTGIERMEIFTSPPDLQHVWKFTNANDPYSKREHITYEGVFPLDFLDKSDKYGFSVIVKGSEDQVFNPSFLRTISWPENAEKFIPSTYGSMVLLEGVSQKSENANTQVSLEQNNKKETGGCLIATATYGSEMAPQVQQLREIRDNSLLQTESGSSFMNSFNSFYYSFSPIIADYERENPAFKEAVKIAITPMLSTLSIMTLADSESEVLGLGISVIALNLGMYFVAPAVVIHTIRKKF